jgi:hypothetical protein
MTISRDGFIYETELVQLTSAIDAAWAEQQTAQAAYDKAVRALADCQHRLECAKQEVLCKAMTKMEAMEARIRLM